jgi:hypothetical protein
MFCLKDSEMQGDYAMKSRIYYACLIAILLLSTVALSTVLETGDSYAYGSASSDLHYSYASADADAQQVYEGGSASGSAFKYTTTGGSCTWYISAYAYGAVDLWLMEGEWACAFAHGQASASGPSSYYVSGSMEASLDQTGTKDYQHVEDGGGEPDGDWNGGNNSFGAYQGLYGSHDACADAEVEEDSGCSASATAWGDVSLSLYE